MLSHIFFPLEIIVTLIDISSYLKWVTYIFFPMKPTNQFEVWMSKSNITFQVALIFHPWKSPQVSVTMH